MRSHGIRICVTVAATAVTSLTLLQGISTFAQAPAQAPARAQAAKPPSKPTPRLADGKPNLGLTPNAKGYWGGGDGPLVQGANFGDLKAIPFQPWARALHEYRMTTLAKDDPYPRCVPHGGPRQFAAAGGSTRTALLFLRNANQLEMLGVGVQFVFARGDLVCTKEIADHVGVILRAKASWIVHRHGLL